MNSSRASIFRKLAWSLPWLTRYPLWRAGQVVKGSADSSGPRHVIIFVGNHFEPAWNESGAPMDWSTQLSRVDLWCEKARRTGRAVHDHDGTPFRHTYFYPAEQYHPGILDRIAELQAEGLGEVEIHLHHGVDKPDTASNLRRTLIDFRDALASEHKCLSHRNGDGTPMYGFIHGNSALANSDGGRFCGVDSEMQILAETGCYADFTLPSAPNQSQMPKINAIYQCGAPLRERSPHRSGPNLQVGDTPTLPIIFTGPLVFDWRRRLHGLPVPRVEDGALAGNYPLTIERFLNWQGAEISVQGQPEWVFVKLYCHGFFPFDQDVTIGEPMRRFLDEVLEYADRSGQFKIHFATSREAFNIAMAAVDGRKGDPTLYRDYQLRSIMQSQPSRVSPMKIYSSNR